MRRKHMELQPERIKIENVPFKNSQLSSSKEDAACFCKQIQNLKSHNHAMEYLCRSWSPSATDFLQMLSFKNPWLSSDQNKEDHESLKSAEETPKCIIKSDIVEMDFNHPRTCLRVNSWNRLFRSRREKKKEETRLHTAQLHAALSLTQLAAAIAGISRSMPTPNSPYTNGKTGSSWNEDTIDIVSSAAALVTTVFAEAAESIGAKRGQVRAAVDSGMAIQTPIDMIAVTATAATCLRGAAILKSRAFANPLARIQEMLKIDSQICVITPSGHRECTKVSFYLKHNHLMLSFGKKYFGGALKSSKKYRVSNIIEEKLEQQGHSVLYLRTGNGIIKLFFENEMQSKIWIPTIFNLLEMCNPSREGSPMH